MVTMGVGGFSFLILILLLLHLSAASVQFHNTLLPPFHRSEMDWVDNNGLFLLSPSSTFAFGFQPTKTDVTLFLLVIIHITSSTIIWTANPHSPIQNSDSFIFTSSGNITLTINSNNKIIWSPNNTSGKPITSIQMRDNGNLVMLGGDNNSTLWESFSHPTDTLISNQDFTTTTKLTSNLSPRNLSYTLEISSGDLILSAGFRTPQQYWSMSRDPRLNINKNGGSVKKAVIIENSWNFYGDDDDDGKVLLLWTFPIPGGGSTNSTWIAMLGNDGEISFKTLDRSGGDLSSVKIPSDVCGTPEHCDPFNTCSSNTCSCPSGLLSRGCKTGFGGAGSNSSSPCKLKGTTTKSTTELVYAGDDLNYVALGYVPPFAKSVDLSKCKSSCERNCSCLVAVFSNSTGDCYLLDDFGSFQTDAGSDFSAYVKVTSGTGVGVGKTSSSNHTVIAVVISLVTVVVVFAMVILMYWYLLVRRKVKRNSTDQSGYSDLELSEGDEFSGRFSGMMPIRFTYKELQSATNGFVTKLGQGGFGSVYSGVLKDGTPIAVKQLEGIGQGKKEFRAEVGIIGSIHHVHLVRLKGFCAEGSHRLLAYELMPKGSLDKWIFKQRSGESVLLSVLDWKTRFSIALGTAKGLAYLHEDCDSKIVHCDIKPENVLLDENFNAKVSDFGLAKLMTREQSHVFTTLRGTRGYLAPEWITNYAISEKSDVYSYGMVLLEIVSGRKNYDTRFVDEVEKSHFPSYVFKMMEVGKLNEVVDECMMRFDDKDDDKDDVVKVIRIALWCIQEDMGMRPSMTKVVQMLEGVANVPDPPTCSLTRSRLFASYYGKISEEGDSGTTGRSSSGMGMSSDCNSDTYVSAVRLSGPR